MVSKSLLNKIRAEHIDPFREDILTMRQKLLDEIRNIEPNGKKVIWRGRKYVTFSGVFQPWYDSLPLLENYKVSAGYRVLDIGTGSGVIAIDAALRGAEVYALDINPDAVKAATINVYLNGCSSWVTVFEGQLNELLKDNLHFRTDLGGIRALDVITGNLPFTKPKLETSKGIKADWAEMAVYDYFKAHKSFFENASRILKPEGRAYLAQANFGNCEDALTLGQKYGFDAKLIGEHQMPDDARKFYAFEFRGYDEKPGIS